MKCRLYIKGIVLFIFIGIILIFISNVCAITAGMGNSRIIVKANSGDIIEKTILVKNLNKYPIKINITVTDNIKDYIKLIDKEFNLDVNETKEARFIVNASKNGNISGEIKVRFSSLIPSPSASVTLSSKIDLIINKNIINNTDENNSSQLEFTIEFDPNSNNFTIIGLEREGVSYDINFYEKCRNKKCSESIRDYILNDDKGNVLNMSVLYKNYKNQVSLEILKLKYNNNIKKVPVNRFSVKTASNKAVKITQDLFSNYKINRFRINSIYDENKNKTKLSINNGKKTNKTISDGKVLLKLITDNGNLMYEIESR